MEVSVSGSITSAAKIRKLYFIGMPLNQGIIKLLKMFLSMNLQKKSGKNLRNRSVAYIFVKPIGFGF